MQLAWSSDAAEHRANLAAGVDRAAAEGARLVALQELTLSPYFAVSDRGPGPGWAQPEPLDGGATRALAGELATRHQIYVHASLYEEVPAADGGPPADGRGYNTAIVVGPDGGLVARTRKVHIPVTAGYYEDRYFLGGDGGFPAVPIGEATFGFPTCWDQWFPELSRAYSLAGAEILVYPTAIGSEPDHPEFDTQPLWQQVIVGQGIANGTFMLAVNRIGTEKLVLVDGTPVTGATGAPGRSRSTGPRSSAIPTGGSWCRPPETARRCWWPTSTSTPAVTGWSCSPSSTPVDPTSTARSPRPDHRLSESGRGTARCRSSWP